MQVLLTLINQLFFCEYQSILKLSERHTNRGLFVVGKTRITDTPIATHTDSIIALLIAISLTDSIFEHVAWTTVALIVHPAKASDAAVWIADRLAAFVGQLISVGTTADLGFGAIVTWIVVTAAAADGSTEATRFIQSVSRIALATPIEKTAPILTA